MATAFRNVVVDGATYRWAVSISRTSRVPGELDAVRLTVIVRAASPPRQRITAVFHGFACEDLWNGRWQNIMATPRAVAEIIRRAPDDGVIDHAELLFPDAITGGDPRDAALAGAASQWFVPYPGREALERAVRETERDFSAIARRFSTAQVELTALQIERWVASLGL